MNPSERQQLLCLPLDAVPFILLDVETTGLEPQRGDRICEIAMIRWQGGVQQQTFQTLINPERQISPAAFAVNRINANLLRSAPTFDSVCDQILAQLDGAVLVAHNAPFDLACLDAELLRLGRPHLSNPLVDTLQLARSFLHHDRYNLTTLAQALGVARPSHRALSDVLALKEVFLHLLNRLRMLGVTTLEDLLRAQRGLVPGQPEPDAPPALLTALREGRRLHMSYRTGGGEPISRIVLPLEMQYVGTGVRITAFCYLRNGQRTFYLDRITDLTLVDETVSTE